MGRQAGVKYPVGIALYLILGCTILFPTTVGAWSWQAAGNYFYAHTQPFTATVDRGQEDGAVSYDDSPFREIFAEGSYLGYMQSAVTAMQSGAYCPYHGCGGYYLTASVFHAFVKNSRNDAPYFKTWDWSASNYPGWSYDRRDYEYRIFIGDPNKMQPEPTLYFAMVGFWDSGYPGQKTNAEIDFSTYLVQVSGAVIIPIYRDYNTKFCVNNDVAVNNVGGNC